MSATTRSGSLPVGSILPASDFPASSAAEAAGQRQRLKHSAARSLVWKLFGAAGGVALLAWSVGLGTWRSNSLPAEITYTVTRADLPIAVTERGELESSKTVDVRCEVEGEQIKIVEILPEGTQVTQGQVVVRFDSEKLGRSYAEQRVKWRTADAKAKAAQKDWDVQKNKSASEIAKAQLTLRLADIDLNMYRKGEYEQEKRGIEGDLLIAEEELKRAQERLEYSERLQKKGYVSQSEVEADRLSVLKAKNTRDVAKEKLRMLEEFSRVRKDAELTANAEDAARELDRTQLSQAATLEKMESDYLSAKDTADMEQVQMERLKAQLDRCIVRAPQDGILVFNKDRPWDASSRIQAGAVVHFQQTLFSLPDLTQMQVKAKIHESAVKKLKLGQQVEVRVDAYPDRLLRGEVQKVATLADSRGWWDQRSVKEYETILKIRDLPASAGLKPGMTAEVKVLVNHLSDVLIVPVEAVVEEAGEHYSYVVNHHGVDRKPIVVGENNEKFVEIKSGLREGERVALDARARMAVESGQNHANGTDQSPPAAGAASAATATSSTQKL